MLSEKIKEKKKNHSPCNRGVEAEVERKGSWKVRPNPVRRDKGAGL